MKKFLYIQLFFVLTSLFSCSENNINNNQITHSTEDSIKLSLMGVFLGDSSNVIYTHFPNIKEVNIDSLSILPLDTTLLKDYFTENGLSIFMQDTSFVVDYNYSEWPEETKSINPAKALFFIKNKKILKMDLIIYETLEEVETKFIQCSFQSIIDSMYVSKYGVCDSIFLSYENTLIRLPSDCSEAMYNRAVAELHSMGSSHMIDDYSRASVYTWANAQLIVQPMYKYKRIGHLEEFRNMSRIIYTDLTDLHQAQKEQAEKEEKERLIKNKKKNEEKKRADKQSKLQDF